MGNRIDQVFARLKEENRAAFIPYLSAGDPDLDQTLDILHALDRAGSDLIEIGVPFSDPLADGLVNQQAACRALESGTTVKGVMDLIRRYRETSETPIVLYTYLNPAVTYGYEKFHEDMAAAGADGILPLDLPPDEAAQHQDLLAAKGLHQIRLVAPTTPPERRIQIAEGAQGFLYFVSRVGVTGAATEFDTSISQEIEELRSMAKVPVAVGFGIGTPEQAAAVAKLADGVVVGSALVKVIAEHGPSGQAATKAEQFVRPIAEAVHTARA